MRRGSYTKKHLNPLLCLGVIYVISILIALAEKFVSLLIWLLTPGTNFGNTFHMLILEQNPLGNTQTQFCLLCHFIIFMADYFNLWFWDDKRVWSSTVISLRHSYHLKTCEPLMASSMKACTWKSLSFFNKKLKFQAYSFFP